MPNFKTVANNQFAKPMFEDPNDLQPNHYSLEQNFPNPFNPTTTIQYALPQDNAVSVKVFDIMGREVAVLVNEHKPAGRYSVSFNADKLPSGMYIYKIQAGSFTSIKKMQVVK